MLVVVRIIVIDIRSIVCLDVVGVVCKVVGSAGVVFAVILGRQRSVDGDGRQWVAYPNVTLNDVADVAGAILVQLYVMPRAFLWIARF